MPNTDPTVWPFSHHRRQIKHAALSYVDRVLGRLEDDDGELLKIRQILHRLTNLMERMEEGAVSTRPDGKPGLFIVAPLPRDVVEELLPIFWHRDIDMIYSPDHPATRAVLLAEILAYQKGVDHPCNNGCGRRAPDGHGFCLICRRSALGK